MSLIKSAGTYITEKEIFTQTTNITANIPTLLVGQFENGAAQTEVTINTVTELIDYFGLPTNYNYKTWFQAYNYLQYTSPIKIIRVIDMYSNANSNASLLFDGANKFYSNVNNLYNIEVGTNNIIDYVLSTDSKTIQLFNKNVTNNETVAISICSNINNYNLPFSNEEIDSSNCNLYETIIASTPAAEKQYNISLNKPISKNQIFYATNRQIELYYDSTLSAWKIYKPEYINYEIKLINNKYYRIIFDETLQDTNTGLCLKFSDLFTSDTSVDFSKNYFVLLVFKVNSDKTRFNLVEKYILNYNLNYKNNNVTNANMVQLINQNSLNIYVALNTNYITKSLTEIATLTVNNNSNNETILNTLIKNDYANKQLNVDYTNLKCNSFDINDTLYKSYLNAIELYMDYNYDYNIRYILPIIIQNNTGKLNIDLSSELANTRKNCYAIVSICDESGIKDLTNNLDKITTICNDYGVIQRNNSSIYTELNSFSVVYDNMKYQYDVYNNKYRYIPLSGDIAGITVLYDNNATVQGGVPAGFDTTPIRNVTRMLYNLTESSLKDKLATNSINLITKNTADNNNYLFDMFTNISGDSIFKRLNVRRLVNSLKVDMLNYFKSVYFQQNTEELRDKIVSDYREKLNNISDIDQFEIICDNSNNTSDIINSESLVISYYIKPVRYIRIINISINLYKNQINITESEV